MGTYFKDITGQKFGKLTAVRMVGVAKDNSKLWETKCDCGGSKLVSGHNLRRGYTQTCGCFYHHKKGSRVYRIWQAMMTRCTNKNFEPWKHYGGRGIKVCDRSDNNDGYHPRNCVWATKKTQARNTRRTKIIIVDGISKCRKDWAIQLGMSDTSLICAEKRGYNIVDLIRFKLTNPGPLKRGALLRFRTEAAHV